MYELKNGTGKLFADPDCDKARFFFRDKPRSLTDKVMSVKEAVATFISDGDYFASGGFGTNRISTAVLHEILRQKKRNLSFAGHTTTHDFQILAAGNLDGEQLLSRVDAAYIVGLEARGLSPQALVTTQLLTKPCENSSRLLAIRLHSHIRLDRRTSKCCLSRLVASQADLRR